MVPGQRRRASEDVLIVGDQEVRVTSPDRVLYPATGTTKRDVIDFYCRAAAATVPHLRGRPATRKRWPEGVEGPAFFTKDIEPGTPAWLPRVQIQHRSGPKFYPLFDTPAWNCTSRSGGSSSRPARKEPHRRQPGIRTGWSLIWIRAQGSVSLSAPRLPWCFEKDSAHLGNE